MTLESRLSQHGASTSADHLFGHLSGGVRRLEDKQLTDSQQVASSPRVPPPGLWVWLYYKDWLPFTFYGALAVLAFAYIVACCRDRVWVWLHRGRAKFLAQLKEITGTDKEGHA